MTNHLYIQHKIALLSIYILNTSAIIPLPSIDSHKKSKDPPQTSQKAFNDNSCLNSNLAPLRAQHLMDRKERVLGAEEAMLLLSWNYRVAYTETDG